MKETVRKCLEGGEMSVFVGYRIVEGHPIPHVFSRDRLDELEFLTESPVRYPLEKLALEMLAEDPELRVGLMARQCTERAVRVLQGLQQVEEDRIRTVAVPCCASALHGGVMCSYLQGQQAKPGTMRWGIDGRLTLEELERLDANERFRRWAYEFEKCVKCYGCRDICPVCVCKECSLQNPDFVESGWLPVEVPLFHLARAVHMAGRCVDCGLCEEACPVDIPLRLLYRKVAAVVEDLFDYVPGKSTEPFALGPMDEGEKERLVVRGAA